MSPRWRLAVRISFGLVMQYMVNGDRFVDLSTAHVKFVTHLSAGA